MRPARSKKFEKQYKKMPAKVQKQFGDRLKLFLKDQTASLLHTHALAGEYHGTQSFNVNADIRAVFEIRDEDVLFFIAIGSHSELYK